MQVLSDIFCSLLAALTAAAFAQFGVTLKARDAHKPSDPEVHRTSSRASASAPEPYVTVARRSRGVAHIRGG